MSENKPKVLFLSTTDAARGPMARAYVEHLAGDRYQVFSAGLAPSGVHPLTRQVLREDDIEILDYQSSNVGEYLGKVHFGYIITVCSHAEASCPRAFMGISHRIYWDTEDPNKFVGTDEETLTKFREARDHVKAHVKAWLDDPAGGSTLVNWSEVA